MTSKPRKTERTWALDMWTLWNSNLSSAWILAWDSWEQFGRNSTRLLLEANSLRTSTSKHSEWGSFLFVGKEHLFLWFQFPQNHGWALAVLHLLTQMWPEKPSRERPAAPSETADCFVSHKYYKLKGQRTMLSANRKKIRMRELLFKISLIIPCCQTGLLVKSTHNYIYFSSSFLETTKCFMLFAVLGEVSTEC